jgi:LEA14-like dessication related protein
MKRKAIYALGIGITAAAVIILVVARVTAPSDTSSTREGRVDSLESLNNFEGIDIAIKNVTAERDRDNELNIQIQFRAFNPNKSTVILEAITYNVFANNTRIVSGDIGEKLEGFVASQESVFPIIANSTITLKDSHHLPQGELAAKNLEEILNGQARYTINGTYSYKQTSSIQAIGADRDFELTFQ